MISVHLHLVAYLRHSSVIYLRAEDSVILFSYMPEMSLLYLTRILRWSSLI
jgi:hypothetical protein